MAFLGGVFKKIPRRLRDGITILIIVLWVFVDILPLGNIRVSLLNVAHAAADPSWSTSAADFEIWESSSLTWDDGTLVCASTLTDTNSSVVECNPSHLKVSTTYRVQTVLKNVGNIALTLNGASDYVQHYNVGKDTGVTNFASASGASTGATLGACRFQDLGSDDGSTTCTAAWDSTVNVRITNTHASGNVVIGVTSGQEGFSYLITTGTSIPNIDSDSYMYVSITQIGGPFTEDSSKIELTGEEFRSTGQLYSSTINLDSGSYPTTLNNNAIRVAWSQDVPSGCALNVYVRGGSTSPPATSWQGPYFGGGSVVSVDLTAVTALKSYQYYQYYVSMTSCNTGSSTPRLFDIKLDFD